MSGTDEKKTGKDETDSFWDIEALIPKRESSFGVPKDCSAREIQGAVTVPAKYGSSSDGTVLIRYIPPHSAEGALSFAKEEWDSEQTYFPEDSLLHRVALKKKKSAYRYYGEFLEDAVRYVDREGSPCPCVPFFSYAPQYNQMNDDQLAHYFWFRQNARSGRWIETEYCYVLLYIYELINLGGYQDAKASQRMLVALWREYHERFPAIAGKLADWICDFSLLHRLPPPVEGGSKLASRVLALKEFYIAMPRGDMRGCARSLLRFCSSYDYRGSKFYAGENEELFDTHIFEALVRAVRYYSADGRLLSGISFNDSTLARDAYAGAICSSEARYRIEVDYCSFSRSNELRFLVGDIVKYAENKLRTHLGIKSKMTVYSLPNEVRDILDAYFAEALPNKRRKAPAATAAYEALYENPIKPLSLSDAARIERESWDTTYDLIEAFEEGEATEEAGLSIETPEVSVPEEESGLARYREILLALLEGSDSVLIREARRLGILVDSLAEQINEIAFDEFGDALIEEGEGGYGIVEEYREEVLKEMKGEEGGS